MSQRVLIVDDDEAIRSVLADALVEQGYAVHVAADGAEALSMLDGVAPDVVLSDVRMERLDGLTLLKTLRERAPSIDVAIMTAYDDMPTVIAAMRGGAVEFVTKPVDLHELRTLFRRIFDDRRSRRSAARAETSFEASVEGLVGRTPEMIRVYKLIGQSACTNATVLIRGESGTGKELVARALHASSQRAEEPFVAVNCAALPSTLLESELFGHVRGAFTGAVGSRRGRFALAGRGTIFLDEIGDTTLDFQTKLLRVLQDHEFERLGGRVRFTSTCAWLPPPTATCNTPWMINNSEAISSTA
jgi:DNA-binding NtrC family response regulator